VPAAKKKTNKLKRKKKKKKERHKEVAGIRLSLGVGVL